MDNARIFVTNFSGHDIRKAFEHTGLEPEKAQVNLTEGNVDIFSLDRLIYCIKQKLRESRPNDLLLLCGSGIINSIAFAQWLEKHGLVRVLLFHAKDKRYILKEVTHVQMYVDL